MILKYCKDLIDLSNRFEVTRLKMIVENKMVRERIMTKENVSDYILFADAHCCPLLKEYAVSYFFLYRREILESHHSKHLKESAELLSEIIMLTEPENEDDYTECLNVNELRKKLGKRKLDVDGSKDALVARLKEAKRQKADSDSDSNSDSGTNSDSGSDSNSDSD